MVRCCCKKITIITTLIILLSLMSCNNIGYFKLEKASLDDYIEMLEKIKLNSQQLFTYNDYIFYEKLNYSSKYNETKFPD